MNISIALNVVVRSEGEKCGLKYVIHITDRHERSGVETPPVGFKK